MTTTPDLVITGGVVPAVGAAPSLDATNTTGRPTTVTITNNVITAVGGEELLADLPSSTRVIDAQGGAILPGIHDGHLHFIGSAATSKMLLPLNAASSWDEVFTILETAEPGPDGWVRAYGWDQVGLGDVPEDRLRTLRTETNVVAHDQSGHGVFLNGAALHTTGLDAFEGTYPGGVISRDATGTPTGLFWDGAMTLVNGELPVLPQDQLRSAILEHQNELHALGFTALTEPGLGPGGVGLMAGACNSDGLNTLLSLAETGELTLRTTVLLLLNGTGGANAADTRAWLDSDLPKAATERGIDPNLLTLGGVKVFADGIPRSGTSWMSESYATGCGHSHGSMTVAGETEEERSQELHQILAAVHQAGLQTGIHATGDATCSAVIDAVAELQKQDPRDSRHYLIHGAFRSTQELDRVKDAGMGYSPNPAIRAEAGSLMKAVLGEERFEAQQPLKTALAKGIQPNIASDAPVTSPDWRESVIAAVTRNTSAGPGDQDSERVTLAQALYMMTATPAWQDHADHARGTLEPGMLADVCVLAEPLPADVERLRQIPATHTVVGGQVVFQSEPQPTF